MSIVFGILATSSIAVLLFVNPDGVVPAFLNGAKEALEFSVTMFCVYALWMPVNKIIEKTGVVKGLGKVMLPLEKSLFPGESSEVYNALTVNLTANMLGAGGSATPMGLKAMETMVNKKNQVMLAVLNATSVQIIPATVLTIRSGLGAVKDILVPTLIVSAITTVLSVILVKIFVKNR